MPLRRTLRRTFRGRRGGGTPTPSTLLDGLVSWWSLDAESGTRFDAHGSNDLTDVNTVGFAAGVVNNAADFDIANGESLTVAAGHGLHGGDRDFTIAAHIYLTSGGLNQTFAAVSSAGDNNNTDWMIYVNTLNVLSFYMGLGGTWGQAEATTFGALSAATWYAVIAEYNAATDTMGVSINDGTVDTTGSISGGVTAGGQFQLGQWHGVGNGSIDGRVDEAAFWTRLLTSAEKTEYAAGIGYGDL